MRQALIFLKKEALHILHTPESLLLMLLFPLALTWVLGTAFSGASTRLIKLPKTEISVVTDGSIMSRYYADMAEDAGLSFIPIAEDTLKKDMADGAARQYVRATQQGITHFTDAPTGIDAALVRTYSRIFLRQSAFSLMALQKGQLPTQVKPDVDYVRMEGIAGKNAPSSFGYYGVTMITMIIMYGAMQAVGQMAAETEERTYLRLKASPFSMRRVFLLKALAASAVLLLQVLVLMLFSSAVYHVSYRSIPVVLLMLIPLVLFSTGLGIMSFQLFRQEAGASGFLNLVIVAMVFLGGGYMMVDESAGALYRMLQYSPVGWVNKGIFQYVYNNDLSAAWQAMGLCFLLAVITLAAAFALFIREEGSDRVAGH